MKKKTYAKQFRGDLEAYRRYLAGMDASMKQKTALTAAHLLCQGRVADMGMGSGSGSFALASLYAGLEVIGVDISATMVQLAVEKYNLPNLRFVQGDIARHVFAEGYLDGIFNSSVLHHVTSFNGYRHEAAAEALAAQVKQLARQGTLIVRDFLAPDEGDILLDLPDCDGDVKSVSSAALFEIFAEQFRKLSPQPGFGYEKIENSAVENPELPPLNVNWKRYKVDARLAVEFLLRKDYRDDWDTEILEEYTYYTQSRFEAVFAGLGLRVTASTPLRNPWIVRNRLHGKFQWWGMNNEPLEIPATNYIIVGERAPLNEGVDFKQGENVTPQGYLTMSYYKNKTTGNIMELARRKFTTLDVLPWFSEGDETFIIARRSYPRPILRSTQHSAPPLDGSRAVGYVTEPLNVLSDDQPQGETIEAALIEMAGIDIEKIRAFAPGSRYYPSPGGILEEVRSTFTEVDPLLVERDIVNRSGFTSSGHVRAIEAQQLLRAAQVGGLPDARLELNVYQLLTELGRETGPWIGAAVTLQNRVKPRNVQAMQALLNQPARRNFIRAGAEEASGFLDLHCSEFQEIGGSGEILSRQVREYVTPSRYSCNTISTALTIRVGSEIYIGLEDRDLPAVQCFQGRSDLWVVPAWRVPEEFKSMSPCMPWIKEQLQKEHGIVCGEIFPLGGCYYPSPGLTPERVFPLVVDVAESNTDTLHWVPLSEVTAHASQVADGHLRISAWRAAHALGLLK